MVDDHDREVTFPGPWDTVQEFMDSNHAVGYFFFSPRTMQAFSSRVSHMMIKGRLFVTSEKQRYGHAHGRKYTIRVARDDSTVGRIGEHGAYTTLSAAHRAARALVKEEAI